MKLSMAVIKHKDIFFFQKCLINLYFLKIFDLKSEAKDSDSSRGVLS